MLLAACCLLLAACHFHRRRQSVGKLENRPNVWSLNLETAPSEGRRNRLVTLLEVSVARRINAIGVIETLAKAMLFEGGLTFIRSDNGPEMVAKVLRHWLAGLGTRGLCIEPGSPSENGYCESFNGKLRDECLNGEMFYSLREAKVVIEQWRRVYRPACRSLGLSSWNSYRLLKARQNG